MLCCECCVVNVVVIVVSIFSVVPVSVVVFSAFVDLKFSTFEIDTVGDC